ncbi:MAG: ammonia-forming cytochrome c nitrite reductase subunit c552 [Planctomycetota bacterium]|nr:MAG: ammonia-forming cytochrome c nitrite reductase subunit c552 [Planctomycetota bacterium]
MTPPKEHENSSSAAAAGSPPPHGRPSGRTVALFAAILAAVGLATFGVIALLVSIFERKQEARTPFVRLVEVNEVSTDPAPWGINWATEFDSYRRTVDDSETQYGGSSAMPASKLEEQPWLKRLYAGYAFSIDYREARGHAYMLYDQEVTERVTKRPQTGACLHCHASAVPMYRRLGLEAQGKKADAETLAADFNWPAVMEGFKLAAAMDYASAHAELLKTPDGTPGENAPLFPGGSSTEIATPANQPAAPPEPNSKDDGDDAAPDPHAMGEAHPVGCIDCHDPKTMRVRITRPGFVEGIAALAASDDRLPHLPSIERWRRGDRSKPYDANAEASRQEMRSFVCAQCHVEYYCSSKETLFFPWQKGLKAEQMEAAFSAHKFPDGTPFFDYVHGETGAKVYKAQHPEFELWAQGVHARSGVACADCHMPYERQGARKVSTHWVRSPLLNINNACQTCHNVPEAELREKVITTQRRTTGLIKVAAAAMTDMLDAIRDAEAAGATPEQLAPIFELQKKAMWRLDFINSENSLGFHAPQEAARVLGESIDFSRQAQVQALRLRAPEAPPSTRPVEPIQGVTPTEKAPPSAAPPGENADAAAPVDAAGDSDAAPSAPQ